MTLILLYTIPSFGQYLIQGQVDTATYKYASLDFLNDWNAFQSVDSELVVNKIKIKPDGSFEFRGSELSDNDGFYRLRYSTDKEGVMISFQDRNYVNFIFLN